MNRFILFAGVVSTFVGKAFAWLGGLLMLVVCAEVVKRYLLNNPTAWIFDATAMMYGALFMLCGAYTLAQDGHVRGDFLYGSMRPRLQASLDLTLYILFFLPGGVPFAAGGHVGVLPEGRVAAPCHAKPDICGHDALHADRDPVHRHHVLVAGHDTVAARLPVRQLGWAA
jgi:TRAP-type C4-dicarboxylate transport system permease small subunit